FLFPLGYNAELKGGYPLVVILHGAGGTGNCWQSSCFWATPQWDPNRNNPPAPSSQVSQLLSNERQLSHDAWHQLRARDLAGPRNPGDTELPKGAFPGFALFPQSLNG